MIKTFPLLASGFNQLIIAEKLLNAGANPNIKDTDGNTALLLGNFFFFF